LAECHLQSLAGEFVWILALPDWTLPLIAHAKSIQVINCNRIWLSIYAYLYVDFSKDPLKK